MFMRACVRGLLHLGSFINGGHSAIAPSLLYGKALGGETFFEPNLSVCRFNSAETWAAETVHWDMSRDRDQIRADTSPQIRSNLLWVPHSPDQTLTLS